MPTYNVAPFVSDAIKSVLAQTYQDFELIVVDDGSTDVTRERIEEFPDRKIRLISAEHQGVVFASNRGISHASGEFVVRADGDDLWQPTLLARQIEVLEAHPEVGAVGVLGRRFGGSQGNVDHPTGSNAIRRRLRFENALSVPVMIRARILREVGGYRAVRWEDWDLWLRVASRHPLRNVPERLSLLRSRPDSAYWAGSRAERELARLAMRWGALRHLGPHVASGAALAHALLRLVAASALDRFVPRPRPRVSVADPPTVSVVVATYGRAAAVARCLASVERQQPPPDEVVVAFRPDDLETAEFARSWVAQDRSRRRGVEVETAGNVHALAAATRVASCETVAYVDDDAVPRDGWLEELRRAFLDPTIGAVGGAFVERVEAREMHGTAKRVGGVTWYGRVFGRHAKTTDYYGDVEWLTGANMAFRRNLVCHDPRLLHTASGLAVGNDLDTSLTVRRLGHRVLFSPSAVVDHYATSFRDPVLGSRVAGDDVFTSAANHTYALLKYLSPARRVAFFVYGFGVGSAMLPGPARVVAEALRSRARARAIARRLPATWRGRLKGIEMYRRWRDDDDAAFRSAVPAASARRR